MPQRLINMDWQIIALNTASLGSVIAATIAENSTGWAVGFLIVTVGILNLAKSYATIRDIKDEDDEE
jgi:dipeptide/tripeptide permease